MKAELNTQNFSYKLISASHDDVLKLERFINCSLSLAFHLPCSEMLYLSPTCVHAGSFVTILLSPLTLILAGSCKERFTRARRFKFKPEVEA
jgi:hypothetical protein